MIKDIFKRFKPILLAVVLASVLVPTVVLLSQAANVNTGVTVLTADSSGAAAWSYSGGSITGSVKANKTSGCTGDSFTAQDGTLTFTNSSGETALLSFDYSFALSGGSVAVDA